MSRQSNNIITNLRNWVAAVLKCIPGRREPVAEELHIHDPIPNEIRRRRVALQASGILDQSRIYGDSRLYDIRDQEFERPDLSVVDAGETGNEDVRSSILLILIATISPTSIAAV